MDSRDARRKRRWQLNGLAICAGLGSLVFPPLIVVWLVATIAWAVIWAQSEE
jgi:hypothetical protein